jgi:hypothetical protein
MRFGSRVLVQRGGTTAQPWRPGASRKVKGILVFRKGNECWVRLTEDDPGDTVGWNKAGQVGVWSKSAVTLEP